MTDRMGSRLGAAIHQSNLGQVTDPLQSQFPQLSSRAGRSPGRRCGQKFPPPEVPRVPASPETGGPAALSPAPAWARSAAAQRSPRPSGGRAASSPGGGGGQVRPSPPPAPRGPSRGRARLRPLPPAARGPAAALAASHPGRASSGKGRPRAGAPLPPAPPSGPGSSQSPGARSKGAAPAGAHSLARRAGVGDPGGRAGSAPRALPPGHLPGCGALLAPALPLTHGSGDTRRR